MKLSKILNGHIVLLIISLLMSNINLCAQCNTTIEDNLYSTDLIKRELRGNVISVVITDYEANNIMGNISKGQKYCEEEIYFNSEGMIDKIVFNSEHNSNTDIYEYDGDSIKYISHFKGDGNFLAKTVFIKKGLEVKEQRYISNGELNHQYYIMKYDKRGNLIEKRTIYHSDIKKNSVSKRFYSYDNQGRIIKEKFDGNTYLIYYDDIKAKLPRRGQKIDDKTNKVVENIILQFDDFGNLISKTSNGILLESNEYQYDKYGNWIRKIEYYTAARIPRSIIERKIEYFD